MEVITFMLGVVLGWLIWHRSENKKDEPEQEAPQMSAELQNQFRNLMSYDGSAQPDWRDRE